MVTTGYVGADVWDGCIGAEWARWHMFHMGAIYYYWEMTNNDIIHIVDLYVEGFKANGVWFGPTE